MTAILSRCSSDDGVRGASAALNSRVDDDGADIIRGGVEALFLCCNIIVSMYCNGPHIRYPWFRWSLSKFERDASFGVDDVINMSAKPPALQLPYLSVFHHRD